MTSNAGYWKPRLAVLVIATSLLAGCGTVGSEPHIATGCPPVVEYTCKFQARAAEELGMLPDGSAIVQMLSDYTVMRDQARVCLPEMLVVGPDRWICIRTSLSG